MITQSELKRLFDYNPDTGEFTRLSAKAWNAGNGSINKNGYRVININNKVYYAHRLAWLYVYGSFPENQIDHINGDPSDNRIENLRDVDSNKNQQNIYGPQKNNTTGFRGVMYMGAKRRGKKYSAGIHHNGKKYYLGYFSTPEEASVAYETKRNELLNGTGDSK